MGPLEGPLGSLGVPWGCLGVPRPIFSDLSKIGRPIPSECVYLHAPASRNSPGNPADPPEAASGLQLATPLSRAGGQDDVSLKETPSNDYCIILMRSVKNLELGSL